MSNYLETFDVFFAAACLDIAIVGAGLSGSYTAWKIRSNQNKVALFEATNHIGGRFHTYRLGHNPVQNLELGALYYIPDVHNYINHTITL